MCVLGMELNIENRLYYFITLLSVWIHLKARPKCLVVQYLSCVYVYQDTTTNHIYVHKVLSRKFSKPNFIGTTMDSQRHVISCLINIWANLVLCLSHLTTSWFLNEFTRLILKNVYVTFLTNFINLLIGLYSPLFNAMEINWFV